MSEPKRYTIERITDIFEIPEDRFKDFLTDFESYYRIGLPMADLIKVAAEAGGIEVEVLPMKMVWVDDGKHDVTLKISTPPVMNTDDKKRKGGES